MLAVRATTTEAEATTKDVAIRAAMVIEESTLAVWTFVDGTPGRLTVPTETLRQQTANGRLAGTHQTEQDDVTNPIGQRITREQVLGSRSKSARSTANALGESSARRHGLVSAG